MAEANQIAGAVEKTGIVAENIPGLDECETLVKSLVGPPIVYDFSNFQLIDRDKDGHFEYATSSRMGVYCWSDGAVQILDPETNEIHTPEFFIRGRVRRPSELAFHIGLLFSLCFAFFLYSQTVKMRTIQIVAGLIIIVLFVEMLLPVVF